MLSIAIYQYIILKHNGTIMLNNKNKNKLWNFEVIQKNDSQEFNCQKVNNKQCNFHCCYLYIFIIIHLIVEISIKKFTNIRYHLRSLAIYM